MGWFKKVFGGLFKKKDSTWDKLDFGKPSEAGDDFRKRNEV